MNAQREMPRYKSHKKVWALKIASIVLDGEGENRETDGSAMITPEEEGYASFKVSSEYMHKHKPQVGGYYVQYEDGYQSWSPAEVFENGNTRDIPNTSAEEKNLYNPTCALTGMRNDLRMYPIRNDEDEMIGWIFLNENVNREDFIFTLKRDRK